MLQTFLLKHIIFNEFKIKSKIDVREESESILGCPSLVNLIFFVFYFEKRRDNFEYKKKHAVQIYFNDKHAWNWLREGCFKLFRQTFEIGQDS